MQRAKNELLKLMWYMDEIRIHKPLNIFGCGVCDYELLQQMMKLKGPFPARVIPAAAPMYTVNTWKHGYLMLHLNLLFSALSCLFVGNVKVKFNIETIHPSISWIGTWKSCFTNHTFSSMKIMLMAFILICPLVPSLCGETWQQLISSYKDPPNYDKERQYACHIGRWETSCQPEQQPNIKMHTHVV